VRVLPALNFRDRSLRRLGSGSPAFSASRWRLVEASAFFAFFLFFSFFWRCCSSFLAQF